MKACKGPGKTAVMAWLAWNFLVTRPSAKIAATSITADNLADNLWAEMAKWQAQSELLQATFEWTKTRIFSRDAPETWWMSARSLGPHRRPGAAGRDAGRPARRLHPVPPRRGGRHSRRGDGLGRGRALLVRRGPHRAGRQPDASRRARSGAPAPASGGCGTSTEITGDPDDPQALDARQARVGAGADREVRERQSLGAGERVRPLPAVLAQHPDRSRRMPRRHRARLARRGHRRRRRACSASTWRASATTPA